LGLPAYHSYRAAGAETEGRCAPRHAGKVAHQCQLDHFSSLALWFPLPNVERLVEVGRSDKERFPHFGATHDLDKTRAQKQSIGSNRARKNHRVIERLRSFQSLTPIK